MADETETKPVTPGFKTTEFWLTLAAWLIAAFLASGVVPETHWAVKVASFVAAALAQLGYTTSRAQLKKPPQGP